MVGQYDSRVRFASPRAPFPTGVSDYSQQSGERYNGTMKEHILDTLHRSLPRVVDNMDEHLTNIASDGLPKSWDFKAENSLYNPPPSVPHAVAAGPAVPLLSSQCQTLLLPPGTRTPCAKDLYRGGVRYAFVAGSEGTTREAIVMQSGYGELWKRQKDEKDFESTFIFKKK